MKKQKIVNVIFNPREVEFIKEASKLDTRSFSNFLRIGALQRAKNIFETLERPIPNLDDEEEVEEIIIEEDNKEAKEDEN